MTDPHLCPGCNIPAPDGICEGCGRVLHLGRFLGLVTGITLFLAVLLGFWCATS